jgi:hypothetical protein
LIGIVGPVAVALAITGAGQALAASQPSAETQATAKQTSMILTSERNARFNSTRSACSGGSSSVTCWAADVPVASLTDDDGNGYCALLTSGGVDCWGYGQFGELGNGEIYKHSPFGSAVPVKVK